MTKNLIENKV